VVVVVVEEIVEDTAAARFFSERVEYIAAVTPAPVAALTAAIRARVVFDILRIRREAGGRVLLMSSER
jgi:hypothetical protein